MEKKEALYDQAHLLVANVTQAINELGNAEALEEFSGIRKTLFTFIKKTFSNTTTNKQLNDVTLACIAMLKESTDFTDIEYDEQLGITCIHKGTPVRYSNLEGWGYRENDAV